MEVGKYMDFHSGSGVVGEDYAVRFIASTYNGSYGKLEVDGALRVNSDFEYRGNLIAAGGANITSTQMSYLSGVTSNIQTQLNSKAGGILTNYGTQMDAVAAGLTAGSLYASMGKVKTVLSDLIYTFPGGSLSAQYFYLASPSSGKAWGLVQPVFPLATANITGGFSISFTATQTNASNNDSFFYIGPDSGSWTGVLAVQMNGGSMYVYGYDRGADATKYLTLGVSTQGTYTWLFSFNPANGHCTVWRNGTQVGSGYCSFTGTNITRGTVSLGGYPSYGPFTGSITNV